MKMEAHGIRTMKNNKNKTLNEQNKNSHKSIDPTCIRLIKCIRCETLKLSLYLHIVGLVDSAMNNRGIYHAAHTAKWNCNLINCMFHTQQFYNIMFASPIISIFRSMKISFSDCIIAHSMQSTP